MYGLKLLLGKMLFLAVPAAIVFCCFYPYRKKALQAMKLKAKTANLELKMLFKI